MTARRATCWEAFPARVRSAPARGARQREARAPSGASPRTTELEARRRPQLPRRPRARARRVHRVVRARRARGPVRRSASAKAAGSAKTAGTARASTSSGKGSDGARPTRADRGRESAPGAAAPTRGKRRSGGQGSRRPAAATPAVAPPQGFEPDTSHSVDPPSGAEVLGAAVGAAGELAQASLGLSRRVLRGAFSLGPPPLTAAGDGEGDTPGNGGHGESLV